MADSLRSRTLRALLWSFIESAGLQGIQVVIGIVLARLLLPEQFGLIGMLTIFIALAKSFLNSGFGSALIQKQDASHLDMCSVFYFNIAVGVVAAAALCAGAPLIAAFYKQPILTPLMRAMTLVIVIESFGLIQNTLVTKRIDFKTLTKRSILASIPSGILGLSLAAAGFGVWSLVAQQLSSSFLMTVLLWRLNKWRPTLVFSLKSLQGMFRFGSRVLVTGLLSTVFNNLHSLVIGKLFSAGQLGFYTRARSLAEIPSHHLTWMVGRVTFPVFSMIQDDRVRLRRGLRKAMTTLILVNFPLMIGGLVVARPLVLALLTEKWAACIPYLRLLCLLGLLFPLQWINANVLYALGRSNLCLRVQVIQKTLVVASLAITWRWGIQAIIWGQIVTSVIAYALNVYYNGELVGYSIRDQLLDICWYLVAALLMGAAIYPLGRLPLHSMWVLLLTQVAVGISAYGALCAFFRLPAFLELWQTGSRRLQSLRTSVA